MGGGSPQPIDYGYFRVIPAVNCTVTMTIPANSSGVTDMAYSVDGGETWNISTKESGIQLKIQVAGTAEVPILWKGHATALSFGTSNGQTASISSTGIIDIEGDFNSLLYGDNYYQNYSLANCAFSSLFRGNTNLRYAHNSIIHCETTGTRVFDSMFNGATNLESPPTMKMESIGDFGCTYMFYNSGIRYCPQPYIKNISRRCFGNMFANCVNITEGMVLPALTLVDSCYSGMYQNCSNLAKIKMLATNINANGCLSTWVAGVAGKGVFIKNKDAMWDRTGTNGIPEGWTVEYE
jgi:hypothetical protein